MRTLKTADDLQREASEAGITITAVIRRAGIADSTYYRWKGGQSSMTLDVYQRLLAALDELRTPREGST